MNDYNAELVDRVSRIQTELEQTRRDETNTWLTYQAKRDDLIFSPEYQAKSQGKNRMLQAERESWLNRECREEYEAYRHARTDRENQSNRLQSALAMIDLYTSR